MQERTAEKKINDTSTMTTMTTKKTKALLRFDHPRVRRAFRVCWQSTARYDTIWYTEREGQRWHATAMPTGEKRLRLLLCLSIAMLSPVRSFDMAGGRAPPERDSSRLFLLETI
mmetsp:Transcript_26618/g.55839  ORF Transcript_26618/g.55839 Transcript_26618/m.55839 type:complete len:114 (+) Transcript_26618:180-521(+)